MKIQFGTRAKNVTARCWATPCAALSRAKRHRGCAVVGNAGREGRVDRDFKDINDTKDFRDFNDTKASKPTKAFRSSTGTSGVRVPLLLCGPVGYCPLAALRILAGMSVLSLNEAKRSAPTPTAYTGTSPAVCLLEVQPMPVALSRMW